MKILYIYPHPDDESFGPAHVMYKQLKEGHEVYLLTLTKGGATKQRHKYGYSVEEMGEVRYKEMLDVEKVLNLSGMTVLDLPDSGLKEMDPREIEKVIKDEIEKIKPDIIVSYPVHGISGFHDHIITHCIVKRVYEVMKEKNGYPKRLAFVTVTEDFAKLFTFFKLAHSTNEEIDCIVETSEEDVKKAKQALSCYKSYQDTITQSNIEDLIQKTAAFELYREKHEPKLKDLFEGID
jgi:N-acetylglucosamine malate deacetylase 2